MTQDGRFPTTDSNNDQDVFDLNTLSFSAIASGDPSEIDLLLKSCIEHGFFYLDFHGDETGQIHNDVGGIYAFMKDYFRQPLDLKMRDFRAGGPYGFKGIGAYSGANTGERDGFEALRIRHFEFLHNKSALPQSVKANIHLFESFLSLTRQITVTILSKLSDALHLEGASRFETQHHAERPNPSALVMMEFSPSPGTGNFGHNEHTDIGTLTLLFNDEWGLQVKRGTEGWSSVPPRKGQAIVNVGDCLRFMSGMKLKSSLHRVAPPPLTQPRSSFGYFLRPDDDAMINTPDGAQISAEEWTEKKYSIYQSDSTNSDEKEMQYGWMESLEERSEGE